EVENAEFHRGAVVHLIAVRDYFHARGENVTVDAPRAVAEQFGGALTRGVGEARNAIDLLGLALAARRRRREGAQDDAQDETERGGNERGDDRGDDHCRRNEVLNREKHGQAIGVTYGVLVPVVHEHIAHHDGLHGTGVWREQRAEELPGWHRDLHVFGLSKGA